MTDATSPSGRKRSASPPDTARSLRSGAAPNNWVPPGIRPQSATRRPVAQALTGSRRNKAVEHSHVWPDSVGEASGGGGGGEAPAPNNHYWLYGAYEYRMQTTIEQARQFVFRLIDKLVEKMTRMHAEAAMQASSAGLAAAGPTDSLSLSLNNARSTVQCRRQQSAAADASSGPRGSQANALGSAPKGHLIFDLIATKKHVGVVPEDGLPFLLGRDIYAYTEEKYNNDVATTFVGLTDNTARRVGRDIFYTKSDELSKMRIPFAAIDREHLFVVFPLQGGKKTDDAAADPPLGSSFLGVSQHPPPAHRGGASATADKTAVGKTPQKSGVKFHS